MLTADECLSLAWTYCAPNRLKFTEGDDFARGFWPDVARVAMAMFEQQSATPTLDFRPTRCVRGLAPEVRVVSKSKSGIDLDKLEINL
jgi:hypothetical protein